MRKLTYSIDIEHFRSIKNSLIPALFTEHQFNLIEKKFSGKLMTPTEKNEFSRTISKKMNAINKIIMKETGNVFVYGKEKMMEGRLKLAASYLRKFSRKFKNKQVFITGSFLYMEKYNDIDVFVVSKYDKEDCKDGEFHINYVDEQVYQSLFFASAGKLCISNRSIYAVEMKKKPDIDVFISLYQELFNELDRGFKGVRSTLREFLVYASFISNQAIPDSIELRQQTDLILKSKKTMKLIKKMFVHSVIFGIAPKKAVRAMQDMISSYKDIMKEYKPHKKYYLNLIEAFKEVISFES